MKLFSSTYKSERLEVILDYKSGATIPNFSIKRILKDYPVADNTTANIFGLSGVIGKGVRLREGVDALKEILNAKRLVYRDVVNVNCKLPWLYSVERGDEVYHYFDGLKEVYIDTSKHISGVSELKEVLDSLDEQLHTVNKLVLSELTVYTVATIDKVYMYVLQAGELISVKDAELKDKKEDNKLSESDNGVGLPDIPQIPADTREMPAGSPDKDQIEDLITPKEGVLFQKFGKKDEK